MGSSQSQPSEAPSQTTPQVVRINREEIPEEYKAVGVSGAVINRVNAHVRTGAPAGAGIAADIDVEKLRAELERERGEKERLHHEVSEMRQLTDLQQRVKTENLGAVVLGGGDVEERKRVFDETVDRLEKQFFNYRRENVCADNEDEIMSCLKANPNRLLKCSNLVGSYEQCVANFRQEVLKGN